jgi:hypothetical protein
MDKKSKMEQTMVLFSQINQNQNHGAWFKPWFSPWSMVCTTTMLMPKQYAIYTNAQQKHRIKYHASCKSEKCSRVTTLDSKLIDPAQLAPDTHGSQRKEGGRYFPACLRFTQNNVQIRAVCIKVVVRYAPE